MYIPSKRNYFDHHFDILVVNIVNVLTLLLAAIFEIYLYTQSDDEYSAMNITLCLCILLNLLSAGSAVEVILKTKKPALILRVISALTEAFLQYMYFIEYQLFNSMVISLMLTLNFAQVLWIRRMYTSVYMKNTKSKVQLL